MQQLDAHIRLRKQNEYMANGAMDLIPTRWHSGCDAVSFFMAAPPEHPDRQRSGIGHRGR